MISENCVAIFVDAENLTQWIKQDGLEDLLEELSSIGPVVVRKAYARWSNPSLSVHQVTLNRLGFELIHAFHPISGKNSADIHIAVDAMEYATRDNLQCIALATGDSDFSPLFRRLREMGKQVLGAGPRSALSESVKTSCTRFFYTDTRSEDSSRDEAARASAFDDAADVLEAALKTFDGPANLAALKNRMLNLDSAFDEKRLGFKSFTDFVKSVEGVGLHQDGLIWSAYFKELTAPSIGVDALTADVSTNPEALIPDAPTELPRLDPLENNRRILRKKNWRSVPAETVYACLATLRQIAPGPRSEIAESAVMHSEGRLTTTDVRKVTNLLFKAGLWRSPGLNDEGEKLWEMDKHVSDPDIFWAIDRAMTARLLAGLEEARLMLDTHYLPAFLLVERTSAQIKKLLNEAKNIQRTQKPEIP